MQRVDSCSPRWGSHRGAAGSQEAVGTCKETRGPWSSSLPGV